MVTSTMLRIRCLPLHTQHLKTAQRHVHLSELLRRAAAASESQSAVEGDRRGEAGPGSVGRRHDSWRTASSGGSQTGEGTLSLLQA